MGGADGDRNTVALPDELTVDMAKLLADSCFGITHSKEWISQTRAREKLSFVHDSRVTGLNVGSYVATITCRSHIIAYDRFVYDDISSERLYGFIILAVIPTMQRRKQKNETKKKS